MQTDPRALRLLLVEDREDDAMLVMRQLERGGYRVTHTRVESETDMRRALEQQPWDLIICDYAMPQFSAPAALATLKASGRDIPFILVSGTVAEDLGVRQMVDGAQDFLSKSNLKRLLPVVERD